MVVPVAGDFVWEQAEWRRLQDRLNRLGRMMAEKLMYRGPGALPELKPLVEQYAEAKRELDRLSMAVAGVPAGHRDAPKW